MDASFVDLPWDILEQFTSLKCRLVCKKWNEIYIICNKLRINNTINNDEFLMIYEPHIAKVNLQKNAYIYYIPYKIEVLCVDRYSNITNKYLQQLTLLKELYLNNNTSITNNGIKDLISLTCLECNTNINNTGISNLENLKYLSLRYNDSTITNRGLMQLSALTQLDLSNNTSITNNALYSLPCLKSITVNNITSLTSTGVKYLLGQNVNIYNS